MTEAVLLEQEAALERARWAYRGCGIWVDPVTAVTYCSSVAYAVLKQRDQRGNQTKGN